MKHVTLCLLAVFSMGFQLLFAQSDLQEGYIITVANDTLHGELAYDIRNPIPLRFKAKGSRDTGIFNHGEILSFVTYDNPYRIYRYMDLDVSSRNPQLLDRSPDPIMKKEHVFLEWVEAGKLNLYYFKDKSGKLHFFIEGKDHPLEELIFTRYIKNQEIQGFTKPVFIDNKQHQIQLSMLMGDCPKAFGLIDRTEYQLSSMRRLVRAYNECHGSVESFHPKKNKNSGLKFGLVGGYTWSKFNFTDPIYFISPKVVDLDRNFHPFVGVSFRLTRPFKTKRITIHNELGVGKTSGFSSYRYVKGNDEFEDHGLFLSVNYLRLVSMTRYQFKTGTIRPFVSAGVSFSRAISTSSYFTNKITQNASITNEYRTNVFNVKRSETTILAGGGTYIGPFSIELRYGYGSGIGDTSSSSQLYSVIGFEF